MDKSPLVSVVVPVYNMEAFLPETLDSILASDYPNFEVSHVTMQRKISVYALIPNLTGELVQPEIRLFGWRKGSLYCLLMPTTR